MGLVNNALGDLVGPGWDCRKSAVYLCGIWRFTDSVCRRHL